MLERLKLLRKSLKMSQAEFARYLGFTQAGYSAIEIGKNPLSDKYIKLICNTFGVSESWLRNGEGEMFSGEQYEQELSSIFLGLTPASRKFLLTMAKELLNLQDRQDRRAQPDEKTDPPD